jgi:hypothetical protein
MPARARELLETLSPRQRLAGLAAVALVLSMVLPWFEKSYYDPRLREPVTDAVSAFGAVSFVEAAVFLVAAGVVLLLVTRARGGAYELPGGDGTVVLGAGAWAALLIFWRVFDRPEAVGQGATVGIQWGVFVAFCAAAALALAGWRLREAERPSGLPAERGEDVPDPPTTVVDDGVDPHEEPTAEAPTRRVAP